MYNRNTEIDMESVAAFQKKLKKQFFLYGSKDLKTESLEIKPELFAAL